jgi:hypothetical protein
MHYNFSRAFMLTSPGRSEGNVISLWQNHMAQEETQPAPRIVTMYLRMVDLLTNLIAGPRDVLTHGLSCFFG